MNVKLRILPAVIAALSTFASAATAADVESARAGGQRALEVLMIASKDEERLSKEMIQALRGQLSDLPVGFRVKWAAPDLKTSGDFSDLAASIARDAGADIGLWCSLDEPTRISLIIAGDDKIIVRSLNQTRAGGRSEAAALIVRAVVNSELEKRNRGPRERIASGRDEPDKPVETKPVGRPQNAVSLQLFYALEVQDAVRPVAQGFGLGVGVGLTEQFSMFARYVFFERITLLTPEVEIELTRHPILLGTGFSKILEPLRIGAEVALIFDYVKDTTSARDLSAVETKPTGGGFLFAAALQGVVAVRLFSSLELFALLGAELPISQPRYVIEGDGERTVVEPWPVRPMGQIGVSIGIF